jgi:hypothetical protein
MAGEGLQKLVVRLGATPPAMVEKIKAVYPMN